MTRFSDLTVADLPPGTYVRHIEWAVYGTVRERHGERIICWDGPLGDDWLADEGGVRPCDVDIIPEAPDA